MRIRTLAPLALAALAACGQAPENHGYDTRQPFAAEAPRGKTFDNPFGENATTPAPESDAVTASDPASGQASTTGQPTISDAPASTPGRSCNDGKRVCGDMDSCEDARFHLEQCGMSRLDGDGDGSPCEKLCGQGR